MTPDASVFEFERDFAGSLRCIPMAVRFNLDLCGVKLSLRQWSKFTRDDRAQLLSMHCDTAEATGEYRQLLTSLIEAKCAEPVKLLPIEERPEWSDAQRVPSSVADYAMSLELEPPTQSQWASLTHLQRFTLLKLARASHDNVNFIPALREFGLLA